MTTKDCRWYTVAPDKLPASFIVEGNKLNFAALQEVTDFAAGPLPEAELTGAINAVVLDFVNQGEDAADASATVAASKFYIGTEGKGTYAFFDTPSGVFVYKESCSSIMINLPWVLGGAAVLGLVGFAAGSKMKGGSKYKTLGFAAAGMALGAGAGVLVGKLATPSYMKTAGLGATPRRVLRQKCPRGMVWAQALRRCVRAR